MQTHHEVQIEKFSDESARGCRRSIASLGLSLSLMMTTLGCDSSDTPSSAETSDQGMSDARDATSGSLDMTVDTPRDMRASDLDSEIQDQDLEEPVDQATTDLEPTDAEVAPPSAEELWDTLRSEIDAAERGELVVLIGDQSGVRFTHEKGATSDQVFPIASASKLLTAILTLKLVEEGAVSLADHPQQHLDWWTDDPSDPRSRVTLAQLLSFTSGFSGGPGLGADEGIPCVEDGETTLDACARAIYTDNFTFEPGSNYFYGPAHMQIAAAMITAATGERWNALFRRLIYRPLELSVTSYPTPSLTNPRAGGGAVSNADDYGRILSALSAGTLLSAESVSELTRDHTPAESVTLTSVPDTSTQAGQWHYALGCWRECSDTPYSASCDEPGIISSPGAFGFYPWLDQETGYWGVIATLIRVRGASVITPLGKRWYSIAKRALELSE